MAKIAVAMSGGVDSSTAAFILKEQGHDIIGITMRLWKDNEDKTRPGGCCSFRDIYDAKKVCNYLGIKHYVFNMEKEFKKIVVDNFVKEYLNGKTPNPCIVCNEKIKFDLLLKKAGALGFDYLSTGHYAEIERKRTSGEIQYYLKKGKDKEKEQTYFLYRLGQSELSKLKFPLGSLTKKEVRKIALKNKIPVAEKAESQEICFVKNKYADFIKSYVPENNEKVKPGPIVDKKGKISGTHKGIIYYTIGQRSGLGISSKVPLYVIEIDASKNVIKIGEKKDVFSNKMIVSDVCWISGMAPKLPLKCKAKVRRQHPAAQAEITAKKGELFIRFEKPQYAITGGQSAVFYERDYVLGGGIIEKAL
ncbi:MAG: tRNA 2-thiouridine(34) synthase MnmA [Elusimicrobia bacterium]|nr:tRNA 2-thiouridine(34) synthase MnmA [Elusimicrobiota bacterium]